MNLVTVEEAVEHLRIDGHDDDSWLETFIPAVSGAVVAWLKSRSRVYLPEIDSDGHVVLDPCGDPVPALDPSGEPTINPVVRAAALLELATLYRFREGDGDYYMPSHEGHGYSLSRASTALLAPLRRPTVA